MAFAATGIKFGLFIKCVSLLQKDFTAAHDEVDRSDQKENISQVSAKSRFTQAPKDMSTDLGSSN